MPSASFGHHCNSMSVGTCACLTYALIRPQEEHRSKTGQDASPATRHRRLSEADVFRVRRRNDEMLRRRRSCADATAERAAAQRARMRRLTEQVRGTSLQVRAWLHQSLCTLPLTYLPGSGSSARTLLMPQPPATLYVVAEGCRSGSLCAHVNSTQCLLASSPSVRWEMLARAQGPHTAPLRIFCTAQAERVVAVNVSRDSQRVVQATASASCRAAALEPVTRRVSGYVRHLALPAAPQRRRQVCARR